MVAVKYLVHVFDGIENTLNPQAVYLLFDDGVDLTFRCANDGETLLCLKGSVDIYPIDMGEFGSEIVKNVTVEEPWKDVVGQPVLAMYKTTTDVGNIAIGYKLVFGTEEIHLLNLGDSLFVFDSSPSEVLAEENVSFRQVL